MKLIVLNRFSQRGNNGVKQFRYTLGLPPAPEVVSQQSTQPEPKAVMTLIVDGDDIGKDVDDVIEII